MCISSFKNLNTTVYGTNTDLVIAKSRGYLSHPNSNLFRIIKTLELSFTKFKDSQNVFEDFLKKKISFKFDCEEHKQTVFSDIYTHYLIMRMRQYTYIQNQNNKKLNTTKKKLSKLVTT